MDIKNDKTLNLCMLSLFASSANIKLEAVKDFLEKNNYQYDSQVLEYYLNNVDQILQSIESEAITTTNTPVTVEKPAEIETKEEPEVDFSAFF